MNGELQLEAKGLENPSDSDPLLPNRHDADSESPPTPPPDAASSSEIKDEEDVEGGSIATCRICLECDGEEGHRFNTLFLSI